MSEGRGLPHTPCTRLTAQFHGGRLVAGSILAASVILTSAQLMNSLHRTRAWAEARLREEGAEPRQKAPGRLCTTPARHWGDWVPENPAAQGCSTLGSHSG